MKLVTFFSVLAILIMGTVMITLAQAWISLEVEFVIRSSTWMVDDFKLMRLVGTIVGLFGLIGTVSSVTNKELFF